MGVVACIAYRYFSQDLSTTPDVTSIVRSSSSHDVCVRLSGYFFVWTSTPQYSGDTACHSHVPRYSRLLQSHRVSWKNYTAVCHARMSVENRTPPSGLSLFRILPPDSKPKSCSSIYHSLLFSDSVGFFSKLVGNYNNFVLLDKQHDCPLYEDRGLNRRWINSATDFYKLSCHVLRADSRCMLTVYFALREVHSAGNEVIILWWDELIRQVELLGPLAWRH